MRRNIYEFIAFVRDDKQKNLPIKILLIGWIELLLPTWLASNFVQETQVQRAIMRAAFFLGLFTHWLWLDNHGYS